MKSDPCRINLPDPDLHRPLELDEGPVLPPPERAFGGSRRGLNLGVDDGARGVVVSYSRVKDTAAEHFNAFPSLEGGYIVLGSHLDKEHPEKSYSQTLFVPSLQIDPQDL